MAILLTLIRENKESEIYLHFRTADHTLLLIVALSFKAIGMEQVLLKFANENLVDWKQGHAANLTITRLEVENR
jgi:hypothetical protein